MKEDWSSKRPREVSGPTIIYSRLLKDHILFVGTQIDDHVAKLVTAQLLFLEAEDPERDIQLYINSPGGSITAGLAIYDTMQYRAARRGDDLRWGGQKQANRRRSLFPALSTRRMVRGQWRNDHETWLRIPRVGATIQSRLTGG
jgi:hypothetical protein